MDSETEYWPGTLSQVRGVWGAGVGGGGRVALCGPIALPMGLVACGASTPSAGPSAPTQLARRDALFEIQSYPRESRARLLVGFEIARASIHMLRTGGARIEVGRSLPFRRGRVPPMYMIAHKVRPDWAAVVGAFVCAAVRPRAGGWVSGTTNGGARA